LGRSGPTHGARPCVLADTTTDGTYAVGPVVHTGAGLLSRAAAPMCAGRSHTRRTLTGAKAHGRDRNSHFCLRDCLFASTALIAAAHVSCPRKRSVSRGRARGWRATLLGAAVSPRSESLRAARHRQHECPQHRRRQTHSPRRIHGGGWGGGPFTRRC
jgi:hypothetical protein